VIPLVLVHGFTGAPASFDELCEALFRRWPGLRVHRPALVGHGARSSPEPARFEQEVDRLAAELHQAGFAGAHLCGYSLGARLSLGLLARHARLFSGATLIGVHPGLARERERAARVGADERWCELLSRQGLEAFCAAWEAQPLFASQQRLPAPRLERQRQLRRRHAASGLCRSLRVLGLGHMPDYRGVLCARALPVQLLVGELDEKFLALGQQLAARAQHVRLVPVEGAGHNLLLEAPERVIAVLTRALEVHA
jgi:2-succinyl-6-hydroxy-2,4-cyclohexadiene-1-carboxylate synthase